MVHVAVFTWTGWQLSRGLSGNLPMDWVAGIRGIRIWAYFRARVAWTMAAFNLLARWSLEIDDENMVRLSIAEFSL